MTFKAINILINRELDRKFMVPGELYLFKANGKNIAAYLDNGELKIKNTEKKAN